MFVNLGSQSLGYSLYQIIITISNFVSGTELQCIIYIQKVMYTFFVYFVLLAGY
jgi:hypothetical protein